MEMFVHKFLRVKKWLTQDTLIIKILIYLITQHKNKRQQDFLYGFTLFNVNLSVSRSSFTV